MIGAHKTGDDRWYDEAMGGQLELVARFPDGTVKISNFSDLGGTVAASEASALGRMPAGRSATIPSAEMAKPLSRSAPLGLAN